MQESTSKSPQPPLIGHVLLILDHRTGGVNISTTNVSPLQIHRLGMLLLDRVSQQLASSRPNIAATEATEESNTTPQSSNNHAKLSKRERAAQSG